jgi:hypothetical protein
MCSEGGGGRALRNINNAKKGKSEWYTKLVQKYNIKYSNYLYYCCIQQSTFLKQPSCSSNSIDHRFPCFPSHRTLRYILTTCKFIVDVTLDWAYFVEFNELLVSSEELETYAFEHYSNLTHFFISWFSYRKHIFVLLAGPK